MIIAVLEDRPDLRQTLIRGLNAALRKDRSSRCVECPLFDDLDAYAPWIAKHNVDVLLLDQVLNEQGGLVDHHVAYKGHNVIAAVRRRFPEYPMFIVTSVKDDGALMSHAGDADAIIERKELTKNPKVSISRFLRAVHRYSDAQNKRLARLAELSQLAAAGDLPVKARKELMALQQVFYSGIAPGAQGGEPDDKLRELAKSVRHLDGVISDLEASLRPN